MKSLTSISSLLILLPNVATFSLNGDSVVSRRVCTIHDHSSKPVRERTHLGAASGGSDMVDSFALGFDFGTSGARVIAVDKSGQQVEEASIQWSSNHDAANPDAWRAAVDDLLFALPSSLRANVGQVCVGGTSATCLLVDGASGEPSRQPSPTRLYNWSLDKDGAEELGGELVGEARCLLDTACPSGHTARAGTSALAKLIGWCLEKPLEPQEVLAHQADFIAAHIWAGGNPAVAASMAHYLDQSEVSSSWEATPAIPGFVSDWHNALKLGFDVSDALCYPAWIVGESLASQSTTSRGGDKDEEGSSERRSSDENEKAAEARSVAKGRSSGRAHARQPRRPLPDVLMPVSPVQGRTRSKQTLSPLTALPHVVQPGSTTGFLTKAAAKRWGLGTALQAPSASSSSSSDGSASRGGGGCRMIAGTTDSIAAFLAAGVNRPGQAVTSLGSTIAVKLLSEARVDDSSRGIYSHRLPRRRRSALTSDEVQDDDEERSTEEEAPLWLVGGASSAGCAVLRAEGFGTEELVRRSKAFTRGEFAPAKYQNYYPLIGIGERFPVNDPNKKPCLDPKPEGYPDRDGARTEYLLALLSALTRVEADGYNALKELGASPLTEVLTAGGGAANGAWAEMRQKKLGVPASAATNAEAAFGLALLATWND